MRAWIKRQHWGWQVPLWIGYSLLRFFCVIIFRPLNWMATEAGSQAIAGARRALAPLLWPLIIIAGLSVMLATMGMPEFVRFVGPMLQLCVYAAVIVFVIYVIKQSLFPGRRNGR